MIYVKFYFYYRKLPTAIFFSFSHRLYLGTKQQNSFILKHFRSRVRSNFALEDEVGGLGWGCRETVQRQLRTVYF
jgi:hypothetical protein